MLATVTALATLLELRYPWIDPVALDLPGGIDVRWYGLGYLVAFTVGYHVLRRLAERGFLRIDPESVGDLVFAIVIGTILGGRLGYILFYDFAGFMANPARIIRIWEGGLSFHGGLIGVIIAAWWFARKQGISLLHLGDGMALAVPFGIFAVRIANFINGELFGRVTTDDVPWAMRFPTDPIALRMLDADGLPMRARETRIEAAYESGAWDAIRESVPLRHPSQLYEAALEGVLLGLILWGIYLWAARTGRRMSTGAYGAFFLMGYGVFRFFVERFRQPDAQFRGPGDPLGTVLGPLTMGQTLSAAMIIAGIAILWFGSTRAPSEPVPSQRRK